MRVAAFYISAYMCWRHFLFHWRLWICAEWHVACRPVCLISICLVFASCVCRPARVRHSKEPRGKRVPDKNALLLRGESSGTAAVAMVPVDGVQLSLWLRADLRSGSKWEVAYKCQKDFYQRQVWGQRGESVWLMGPDPSALFHNTLRDGTY